MFPQDPCIIYIEKSARCKFLCCVCLQIACLPFTAQPVLARGRELRSESAENVTQKLPQGQERAKEEVEVTSGRPHPVSGVKQLLGLRLVMLNLDPVVKAHNEVGAAGALGIGISESPTSRSCCCICPVLLNFPSGSGSSVLAGLIT